MAHKIGTDAGEDLIGTDSDDWLEGLGGKDRLYGKGGNDLLYGGDGNDQLLGGAGRDTMFGGAGDDTYQVDHSGDIVSETSTSGVDDGGIDLVQSSISYSLGIFIEKLQLTGTDAIDGAGNGLGNDLRGNDVANVLSGYAGIDTLSGGGGDDTLIGGSGKDYLTGGAGSDLFLFGAANATSVDKVQDFSTGDRLGVYAPDYNLAEGHGLVGGALDPSYFTSGAAATAVGHGQFVFDSSKATLLWDPDGLNGAAAIPITTFTSGTVVTAGDIKVITTLPSVSITASPPGTQSEDAGSAFFTLKLSEPAREDVILTYSTFEQTATSGQDFVGISSQQVIVPAGGTTAVVKVDLLNDDLAESQESFGVRINSAETASHQALSITTATASGSIVDEGPRVVAEHDLAAVGIPDPSGIAYNPATDTLFVSDAEIEEYLSPTNLFALSRDGTLKKTYSVTSITNEPCGLAFDSKTGKMFFSDDDKFKVICVDPSNPTVALSSFLTKPLGGDDPEDIAINPANGHLFIVNGLSRSIVETDETGSQVFRTITLPAVISDPEALAYDPQNDVFYVGGGFSANIWRVGRDGTILETMDLLSLYRHPTYNTRVGVKDLELAPSTDGSGEVHLYALDFGADRTADGRMFEIDLGDTSHSGWMLS
ncbi:Calx-beta domain-containing protein [Microvirga massiliensis]|uniref:Calx-beta domain-containing protein n=1 Tax=Microvirga massiliensis TaxID=1033741 RepID=UPI0006610BE9|nr:Calx-beta domain-containing protein [Microvirga massiliensis]